MRRVRQIQEELRRITHAQGNVLVIKSVTLRLLVWIAATCPGKRTQPFRQNPELVKNFVGKGSGVSRVSRGPVILIKFPTK